MPSIMREVGETFGALVKGFSVTFRTMFRKTVTENYPHEPVHFQPRYRGIHVLHRDENGLEKCVGCFLCAAACPANCIYIEAAENTDANRISAGERYASVYNIDYSRRGVPAPVFESTLDFYSTRASPMRNSLPCSVDGTRVLVARR